MSENESNTNTKNEEKENEESEEMNSNEEEEEEEEIKEKINNSNNEIQNNFPFSEKNSEGKSIFSEISENLYSQYLNTDSNKKVSKSVDLNVHIGDIVEHKAYGKGRVVKINTDRIFVSFNGVEKMFYYPGAFEKGFLRR